MGIGYLEGCSLAKTIVRNNGEHAETLLPIALAKMGFSIGSDSSSLVSIVDSNSLVRASDTHDERFKIDFWIRCVALSQDWLPLQLTISKRRGKKRDDCLRYGIILLPIDYYLLRRAATISRCERSPDMMRFNAYLMQTLRKEFEVLGNRLLTLEKVQKLEDIWLTLSLRQRSQVSPYHV